MTYKAQAVGKYGIVGTIKHDRTNRHTLVGYEIRFPDSYHVLLRCNPNYIDAMKIT